MQGGSFFNKTKRKVLALFSFFMILCVFYAISYFLQIFGKNFSITLFVYRCIGVCMLASIFLLLALLPRFLGKFLALLILGVSIILVCVDFFCFVVFKSPLSEAMLATVLETNFSEIVSFIKLYFSTNIALCGFALIVVMGFVTKKMMSHPISLNNGGGIWYRAYLGFLALSFVGFLSWGYECFLFFRGGYSCQYRNHLAFITPIRDLCFLNNALHSSNSAKIFMQKYQENFSKNKNKLNAKNKIDNIVVILGESLSKNHMQLYGYAKPTTPFLTDLSKSKNLIVFDNVISPHAQTTLSLRKVLTFLDYENERDIQKAYEYGNLISIFNSANYSTFWVSNQMDKNNGVIGAIASFATKNDFVSRFKQTFDDVFFDEKILPSLDGFMENNKTHNLFVIHLMGSHASYGNRYPSNFRLFDDSSFRGNNRTISRYDNSVLYNDYVVGEIFKRFSESDSIVFYISDHGEEVYENGDFLGHSDDRISRFMVEIPMLVYASDSFIKKHPLIYQQIVRSRHNAYMTDDLIHTLLDIAGIETEGFDQTRSVINQNYNSKRKRVVGGSEGVDYDAKLK